MALKALMLRKKIDSAKKDLENLRNKDADFTKRETEIEASIEEAETDEEKTAVEEAVDAFDTEKREHDEAKAGLEKSIGDLEAELAAEEARQESSAPAPENKTPETRGTAHGQAREEAPVMGETRDKFFNMSTQERDAFFRRDDVKDYLADVRGCIREKRALTNVGLTIPEVFLGVLRENISEYSKLYKHVTVQRISGTGREVIMGSVPEAVWTECCGTLNELSLGFNDVEVDCYKVGGFFKVCNAILEDSDVQLASVLIDALGQAIGIALDKAILYGRNSNTTQKMPQGVVTRLVQTAAPADYPATAREWKDLHSSNVIKIAASKSGVDLFKEIVKASGATKNRYARRSKVWAMNETTYTTLIAEAMSMNAAGAIVSGQGNTMPVVGGAIELLDFIPDNVIIGGYFELYTLSERAGSKFASSEHVFFIQDNTVFKGTARYDGVPVIAEAFVVIGINGTTANSTMTFASDDANSGE